MNIFLSYRRRDTAGHAGRLSDVLEKAFGDAAVFQDLEAIAPGADFVDAIEEALAKSKILLVLIGREWLSATDQNGQLRLHDPKDFVRLEIAVALRRKMRILPILVEGAVMPEAAALPADIAPFARRQTLELSDSRWDYDTSRVIDSIRGSGDRFAAERGGKRRILIGIIVVAALIVLFLAVWLRQPPTPELTGQWMLPSGSYWTAVQTGNSVAIEEVHYQSREVWKRGAGTLDAARLSYRLDHVFQPGVSETGVMQIDSVDRIMTGTSTQQPINRTQPITLIRSQGP